LDSRSVLIGIPHRDQVLVDPKFITGLFANLFALLEAGISVGLHQVFGHPLDHVRNSMVNYFLGQTKATHLFFLDDDILLHADAITRLLKHKAPIVSGLYKERRQEHRYIVIDTPRGRDGKLRFYFRRAPKNRLVACDVVPAGCLLVERSVFQRLQRPWFHIDKQYGEDVYFSLCARKAGYRILVDTAVDCLHNVTHITGSDESIERWKTEFGFSATAADAPD
jgi:GT2 family glycosyltransferase